MKTCVADIFHAPPLPMPKMNGTRNEEENTKLILEKIEALNKKQGLFKKKIPSYFHFPLSYSRERNDENRKIAFPASVFQNPILEYLKSEKTPARTKEMYESEGGGVTVIETNPNAAVSTEDEIPGQIVKRKITHQQTVFVPSGRFPTPPRYYEQNPQTIINQYISKDNKKDNKANMEKQTVNNIKNIVYNSRPYAIPYYQEKDFYSQPSFGRQFTSPLGQYFPIYIKDPFVQMFNAITSMVEYGPAAGMQKPCAKQRAANTTVIRVAREKPTNHSTKLFNKYASKANASLPNREKATYDDESAEDKQSLNSDSQKLFSRDNTGSGIFIQRLKVRKGGVAIAGPGGIATAGSGGTAIVGPNGYAYTQPDSLAIAGSGTKVIAVEPSVNLAELIQGGAAPNKAGASRPRVGKVVAVGPVIYYNKG